MKRFAHLRTIGLEVFWEGSYSICGVVGVKSSVRVTADLGLLTRSALERITDTTILVSYGYFIQIASRRPTSTLLDVFHVLMSRRELGSSQRSNTAQL